MSIDKLKITNLSQGPGVYIFKDAKKEIIYIGKATNLRSRVSSYFQGLEGSDPSIGIGSLQNRSNDFLKIKKPALEAKCGQTVNAGRKNVISKTTRPVLLSEYPEIHVACNRREDTIFSEKPISIPFFLQAASGRSRFLFFRNRRTLIVLVLRKNNLEN
ncbi:MAG TPA: hypothetical protein DIT25_00390 [Candidatus Moranbacteria bacterium]|nr:hypothetical protein [Candidatus Moranbacteria bacterium]